MTQAKSFLYPQRIIVAAMQVMLLCCLNIFAVSQCLAEESASEPSGATASVSEGAPEKTTSSLADQIRQGGVIVIVLILLSVAMLTFAIERIVNLQRSKFLSPGLSEEADKMWKAGQHDELIKKCSQDSSTLSRVIAVLATYRNVTPADASGLASDIASQDMRMQMQKIIPFALIATISPLLGLLGTVSGMIDSFEVVSLAGSLGNASILADGISHALVTTAAGLIVAVPAIALFNIFKIVTNKLTLQIEVEINHLINEWFLKNRLEAA